MNNVYGYVEGKDKKKDSEDMKIPEKNDVKMYMCTYTGPSCCFHFNAIHKCKTHISVWSLCMHNMHTGHMQLYLSAGMASVNG